MSAIETLKQQTSDARAAEAKARVTALRDYWAYAEAAATDAHDVGPAERLGIALEVLGRTPEQFEERVAQLRQVAEYRDVEQELAKAKADFATWVPGQRQRIEKLKKQLADAERELALRNADTSDHRRDYLAKRARPAIASVLSGGYDGDLVSEGERERWRLSRPDPEFDGMTVRQADEKREAQRANAARHRLEAAEAEARRRRKRGNHEARQAVARANEIREEDRIERMTRPQRDPMAADGHDPYA